MAYKLQHWLVRIEYLPGVENTMADALSREERCTNNTAEEAEPTPDEEHQPQPDGETEVEEDARTVISVRVSRPIGPGHSHVFVLCHRQVIVLFVMPTVR